MFDDGADKELKLPEVSTQKQLPTEECVFEIVHEDNYTEGNITTPQKQVNQSVSSKQKTVKQTVISLND